MDHATRHRLPLHPYADAINLTVDYLVATWVLPCYDWWEEFPEQCHTSTLAAVHSGLTAALESGALTADREPLAQRAIAGIGSLLVDGATHAGHLTKWLGSPAVDGSLLACLLPYRVVPLDGPVATGTVRAIRDQLLDDGVYRYVGDTFYGGGEWVNLTAWLGWYEAATGDTASARRRLEWIVCQARDGLLPEQITAHAQHPGYIERWENMWGPVATPLLWSHAMFLVLASAVAS